MKAEKKPKRPNPVRSNIGFVRGNEVITRTGHQRVTIPPQLPFDSLKTGKAKRALKRQPQGYRTQGMSFGSRHLHPHSK